MAFDQSNPQWDMKHLGLALEAAGVALWSWNVDTDAITLDEHGINLWGLTKKAPFSFEDLSAHIHPADLDRVRAGFSATRGLVGAYEIDFRVVVNDEIRWICARGQGGDANIVERLMYGIFLNVTLRKQAEEANELLAGEMSHRVKNLLAVASALSEITSRSATTAKDMARDFSRRLTALGRVHDLVRPLPGGKVSRTALLGDLLALLLAPYDDLGTFDKRVRVSVPRIDVGEETATTLALIVHELATNSLKFGALSEDHGTIDVTCILEQMEFVITWTERGGPPVVAPAMAGGFGSRMIDRALLRQLGDSISFDWSKEGLIVTLRMQKYQIAL